MPDNKSFSDSVFGKILIGVSIAVISGVFAWIGARITYEPPPPVEPDAQITPKDLTVLANDFIEFSAAGSKVGAGDPAFRWRIGGLEPNRSPTGRCRPDGATLRCRFALPGTFAVAVDVVDENGLSDTATAAVTVAVRGGYLGLAFSTDRPEALRALLYDVDWVALQSLVARPIVLQHPETGTPVYAALAEAPANLQDPPPWRGAASGLKVVMPRMRPGTREAFETALFKIGAVPVALPAGEIFAGLEKGVADLGLVPIDSPAALGELERKFRE